MNPLEFKQFSKILHESIKLALNSTKTCYVLGCSSSCIKSHSISNSRYLKKISTNGEVLYMSLEHKDGDIPLNLIPTGKAKATTFPGFCDVHDKFFEPIDNKDYLIGDDEQNFLFAYRAAAREYTVRNASERMLEDIMNGKYSDLKISDEGKKYIKEYLIGFSIGTKDVATVRTILNINYLRKRYWKLHTEVLTLDKEYPIVASSTFKLERDNKGMVVNLIQKLTGKSRPFFFSIIPQNGQTFCIMSWYQSDESYYSNLHGMNNLSDKEKRIIISNLLCSYVENFAVKPAYWEKLPKEILDSFYKQWGKSMYAEFVPFIYNKKLSIFVDK